MAESHDLRVRQLALDAEARFQRQKLKHDSELRLVGDKTMGLTRELDVLVEERHVLTERCATAEKAVQIVREHFATYLRELKRLGFTPAELLNLQTALPPSSTSSLFTILTVSAELPTVPLDDGAGLFATAPVRVGGGANAASLTGRIIVADKCVQSDGEDACSVVEENEQGDGEAGSDSEYEPDGTGEFKPDGCKDD